jgi:hypothetical protein
MERKILKTIQNTSLVLTLLLILWVLFMVLLTSGISENWTSEDYLQFAKKNGLIYSLSYVNAVVFTVITMGLLGLLYLFTRNERPALSIIGIIFVPVYGVLNIFAYGSQITVVPQLLSSVSIDQLTECRADLLVQWIQTKPQTTVGMINGAAYAVLGIPSICFGLALYKTIPFGKVVGWLLMINAILCSVGLVGYVTDNLTLANGIVAGGFLFTLAVFFIFLGFSRLLKQAS